MGNPHGDDRALARRLLWVDEEAFEEFWNANFPRLFQFALNRLDHDEDAAGEVVQASLLKAVDKLESYRGDSSLFTWLCAICRREAVDYHRARKRIANVPVEDSPAVRAALDRLSGQALESPEEALRRRQLIDRVHATLDHLPRHYGEALEMRYMDALPVREVAARLKLGYKAAEAVLARARAAFRKGFGALSPTAAGAKE